MPLHTSPASAAPSTRIDWAGLGWLYLFFWYFSGVTQALLLPTAGFQGFRDVFYLSFMWLAPVLLAPRFTRQIAAAVGVVLWATSLVSLGYWGIYGHEFSQSVIFTIFESNFTESREYLDQYVGPGLLIGIVIYTAGAALIWRKLRPVWLPRRAAIWAAALVLLLNVGYPYAEYVTGKISFGNATIDLQKRLEPAAPWQLLMGYLQYRHQLVKVEEFLANNKGHPPLDDLADANGDTPRTLVLVIGESTTSQRMSLYGYSRPTTPRLDALAARGELTVFRDVIASCPYTIEILRQALSFANQLEPDRYLTEPNIVNLMKQAGYKTFWITNQQTMTKRNTLLTAFSQVADEVRYLNHQRIQNAGEHDEVVLEPFADALADPAAKKFIVVHLLGTHAKYIYRYPDEFDRFGDSNDFPSNLDDDEADLYNTYDNAVLYNDHVVTSLIERFAASRANGFLLYFSDHGEEVFNDPRHEVLGRDVDAPTLDMFAIPFIVWQSPEWRKTHRHDLEAYIQRPYSNDDFIHTWSDLAGLSYDRFLPERSLVNAAFEPRTRWIGDPESRGELRDFDRVVPRRNKLALARGDKRATQSPSDASNRADSMR
jgi:heptose-I-phosphate ethanolaminephosphotransferase